MDPAKWDCHLCGHEFTDGVDGIAPTLETEAVCQDCIDKAEAKAERAQAHYEYRMGV